MHSISSIDKFDGEYFFLSNFYNSVQSVKGKPYKTNEHYFQAEKADNEAEHEQIRLSGSAAESKKLGRKVKLRSNWESIKDQVMLDGLRAKFSNPILKQKLLDTGDAILIEGNTWQDKYWGVCGGVGKNKLGILLMKVREELKK